MCKCYQGPLPQKKYLFANNVDWFFGYGLENICKLMNLTNKNKRLNFFADPILTKTNSSRKLPLNKMIYFDDLVIHFDKVFDTGYRGKNKICCRCLRL